LFINKTCNLIENAEQRNQELNLQICATGNIRAEASQSFSMNLVMSVAAGEASKSCLMEFSLITEKNILSEQKNARRKYFNNDFLHTLPLLCRHPM
jgi:hypothetical protein